MTTSLGTDIIEVARIENAIQRRGQHFLNKLFTAEEQRYCSKHRSSSRHFAGRFAAKEAIAKALGTGFGAHLAFADIEIKNNEMGKPEVFLKGRKRDDISVSISHCKEYAMAVAMVNTIFGK